MPCFIFLLGIINWFGAIEVKQVSAGCSFITDYTEALSYQSLGGDCYYFSTTPENDDGAFQVCDNKNGTLTSILSQEENTFILNHLVKTYGLRNENVYIGLLYGRGADHSLWDDGKSVSYDNFDDDIPEPTATKRQCVVMKTLNGKWGLKDCYVYPKPTLNFVCKFEGKASKCEISIPETNLQDYKFYGNQCYYFSGGEMKDQTEAYEYCQKGKGYLVSLLSREENEFVRKTLVNTYGLKNKKVLIGLGYIPHVYENFEWDDFSTLDYTNYKDGRIDHNGKCTNVVMDTLSGKWEGYSCKDWPYPKYSFVCKFESNQQQIIQTTNQPLNDCD